MFEVVSLCFKMTLVSFWNMTMQSQTNFIQSPCYSAPSIFALFRNLVWEIWFEKSGLRNLVRVIWFEKSGWPEKKIWVCRTTFLKPLFYTFLEKWLQNKWSIALVIKIDKYWYNSLSFQSTKDLLKKDVTHATGAIMQW